MKKTLLCFVLFAFAATESNAQFTRYIIRLKDKGTNPYSISNPSQYLTARAIARRTRYAIPIDSADLPVTPRYIDSIRLAGAVTVLNSSKWLNQVAIQTNDVTALNKINTFPFVLSSAPIAARRQTTNTPVNKKLEATEKIQTEPFTPQNITADHYSYGLSYPQVHIHNGEFLHNRGFRGDGMHMAVIDAGFQNYLTMPTFDSIRNNGQILGTWDFVSGNASVNEDHPHGSNCFSTIAANMPGVFIGTAPKTSFYLYRSEDAATEYPVEEQNWAAAAERADSLGVDICSVSLGYTTFDNALFNYTYANMNGNTSMIARAADIASKKGMLVAVAAGNDGSGAWHYVGTAGDADSVLTVGAVNSAGTPASFSSYGPSSDGQVKPTIAAVGWNAIAANTGNGQPAAGNGTSFATPIIAGLATCLWQAFPEVNNMNIISVLQQAGNRTANPDDRTGYGIPDMKKAFVMLVKQLFTKQVQQTSCSASLQWTVKTDSVISIVVERKLATETSYTAISTQNSTGAFTARNFSYTDDLRNINASSITYRLRMNIAADTSFYLDSATISFTPKPALGTDKTAAVCTGNSINLTTQFTTTGLTTAWTLGGNTVATPAAVTAAGNYQLIATNTSGCADTALVTASFFVKPDLGTDKTVSKCSDSSTNITTLFSTTGLTAQWTYNNAVVANPAAVTAAGNYRLEVTNTSGCKDTAMVTVTNDAGLCPVLQERTVISPSPVTDNLNVAVIRVAAVKTIVTITNALGQTLYTLNTQQAAGGATYTIPMKKFSAGVYFVSVKVNEEKETVKAVMKR
jgi:serine protease AprX